MGIRRVYVQEINLDEEAGQRYLAMNTWSGQRHLQMPILQNLRAKWGTDKWTMGRIVLARETFNNNQEVLINGQHQCTVAVEKKVGQPAYLEVYEVDSPEDELELYCQIDEGISHKRALNYAHAKGAILGIAWPDWVTLSIIRALHWLENGGALPRRLTNAATQQVLTRKHLAVGSFIYSLIKAKSGYSHLNPAPVLAAVIATFETDPADARDFWTDVARGANLDADSPQWLLFTWLKDNPPDSRTKHKSRLKEGTMMGKTEFCVLTYNKCITAWNAYRRSSTEDGSRANLKVYKTRTKELVVPI